MSDISVYRCENYDFHKIKSVIEHEIDDIGGIKKFVSKGDRVAIKPNLVMW